MKRLLFPLVAAAMLMAGCQHTLTSYVNPFVGTDGHVYNARQSAMPQGTALVTSPIATTVNGQPSLVAERGPEIVIGRRTTRHIMLNEPGLLQHLAALDRRREQRFGPLPAYRHRRTNPPDARSPHRRRPRPASPPLPAHKSRNKQIRHRRPDRRSSKRSEIHGQIQRIKSQTPE